LQCQLILTLYAAHNKSSRNKLTLIIWPNSAWRTIMLLTYWIGLNDVIAIIIYVIYFKWRRIWFIWILFRATVATSLPWPIADLQVSIVMQPRSWIMFDHQGTQLLDTFTKNTLVILRAIRFMWKIDGPPISGFREWTYCVDGKLLGVFFRNRLHRLFLIGVCGVHGPRCQEGDGDYVYSYVENYIKILIDTIESWSNFYYNWNVNCICMNLDC